MRSVSAMLQRETVRMVTRPDTVTREYVQGFCVPAENETKIEVRSGMAHAWPEVYIEGKGWIPFEPTPGYGEKRYAVRKENTLIKHKYFNDKEEIWEEDEASETEALDILPEENMGKPKELSRWAMYAGRIALFVITSGMLAFVADRVGEKHREKRRSLSEKYRIAVLQNLQMSRKCRLPLLKPMKRLCTGRWKSGSRSLRNALGKEKGCLKC